MAELTLADLGRWEEHGATWRLLDGDPELLGYVRAREPD
jgi:hypothetical protein